MAEMPPHGANHVQPLPQLPPGVYFSPSEDECLGLLNRSIAGDAEMRARDTWGHVHDGNVYGETPDALRQQHPPASVRDRDHTWWFLSQTRFQSQNAEGSKRADRQVTAGGYWRLEQSKVKLDGGGFKNTFGYYIDGRSKSKRKDKTPWLMQEFTSVNDDGKGKRGAPALYMVYVTPRATDDQLREIFGEEGVRFGPDGNKKPARTMVWEDYFDGVASLLPPGSVRGEVAQEHVVQAPPPPPPEGLLDYYGQQEEHYLGQYDEQPPPLPPVAPEGLVDFYSQQGEYLGPYQYEQDQYLAQYEQQQEEPLSMVAPPLPPPASPGLLAELAADVPSDNLTTSMADIMRMIDGEPAEMVNEQPAVTTKGEEPNWESFDNIVGEDELANFNKEG